MGRPYGVYIEILAKLHITLDLRRRHHIAIDEACVMMVHTLELHGPSIHKENPPLYTDILEPNPLMHT